LKYLFCALLVDGTLVEQTHDDIHPTQPGRNAFYSLLEVDADGNPREHEADGRIYCRSDIVLFQLECAGTRYLVDLRDGHFEVQHTAGRNRMLGSHFYLGFPPHTAHLRPFYFRRRRHHANVSGTVQSDLSVHVDSVIETSQECEYHFGWETEDRKHRAEIILV